MDIKKVIEERQKNRSEADRLIDEIVDRLIKNYFQETESKVKLLPEDTK